MNTKSHPIGSEEYWQEKIPMSEIPKWYLNLTSTTEEEVKHIQSLTRQEWNNYLTIAMDPPFNEQSYLTHKSTPEEPWGYISEKSNDDNVLDLMETSSNELDIGKLPKVDKKSSQHTEDYMKLKSNEYK